MQKLFLPTIALLLTTWTVVAAQTPAEQLGWTLAIHSYTFQKFSIFDAIDKTAARFRRSGGRPGHIPVLFWSVTEGGAVDLAGPRRDPWRVGANRLRLALTFML